MFFEKITKDKGMVGVVKDFQSRRSIWSFVYEGVSKKLTTEALHGFVHEDPPFKIFTEIEL